MVASPTNGELGFAIVLPASASMTTSSTLPVITTLDEGVVIGHAGIWYADRNELCFMIGPEYWRQGYITEVLAALVPIFWQNGLENIYADVNAANVGSMKVLMNFGFLPMGEDIIEDKLGEWYGLRMGLTAPDGEGEEEEEEDDEFADENSSGDMIGDKDA